MTDGLVDFEDWQELDLRVAEILEVEDISGADKLYKITLDVGSEIGKRTVCAGLKEHYSKEELKGKKVILFVNLVPRKLRGTESQGMILAACNENDVVLLTPEKDIGVGSVIK